MKGMIHLKTINKWSSNGLDKGAQLLLIVK